LLMTMALPTLSENKVGNRLRENIQTLYSTCGCAIIF